MLIFFLTGFLASTVGAICGIGGGVIIKPVLDLFQLETVSAINFLSSCTVLAMSSYSVGQAKLSGDHQVSRFPGLPLALGAATGGLLGGRLFSAVKEIFHNPNAVGSIQAASLAIITAGTLLYTLNRRRIPTLQVQNKLYCVLIGLSLGCISSFLGIGGGPINLAVLYFFFSMDTKTAAANSLYIIFFSQLFSLLVTLATSAVPLFQPIALILMATGGVCGGITGRALNRKFNNRMVDQLFILLMVAIIGISFFNCIRYVVG